MTNIAITHIQNEIVPLRNQIIEHSVYSEIKSLEDLRIFMKYHVFAVWDFMSLLKALQNKLTCVEVPWFPIGNPNTRFLINEIVVGEETDIDEQGNRKSHYELYLEAMAQCNADVNLIVDFTRILQEKRSFENAFSEAKVPPAVRNFVNFTFKIINSGKAYLQSAIFTFGREDLIPGMFIALVKDLSAKFPNQISIFKYYLERHIEVDGDHHSHLALEMTSDLCGLNKVYWQEALEATQESLRQRIHLWDAALEEIRRSRN